LPDITPQLGLWIQQLRAIAQTGLAFNPPIYDRERYEQLLELAARIAATVNGSAQLDIQLAQELETKWRAEVGSGVPGYVTPKVGAGAIVFNNQDELLLIRRAEGVWFFPTGWCDIGWSPAQTVVKEMREEVGLDVTPLRIIGVYDSTKWRPDWLHLYSIVFYCRLDGGALRLHPTEVLDAGFFKRAALPSPLMISATNWVEHAWQAHHGERTEAYFDR
jgi:ADP-ribose pyrophosphatase YjhB (NUDIX family)